jgi:hypothetical protein
MYAQITARVSARTSFSDFGPVRTDYRSWTQHPDLWKGNTIDRHDVVVADSILANHLLDAAALAGFTARIEDGNIATDITDDRMQEFFAVIAKARAAIMEEALRASARDLADHVEVHDVTVFVSDEVPQGVLAAVTTCLLGVDDAVLMIHNTHDEVELQLRARGSQVPVIEAKAREAAGEFQEFVSVSDGPNRTHGRSHEA